MDGPSITLRRAIINFSLFVTVLRFVQWVAVFTKKGGMLYTSSDTRISPYDFLSVMVREVTKCCQLGISTTLITASNLVMTREVAFELFCSHAHTDGQKQYSLHGNAGGLCKGQSSCLALVKKHNYSWKCWTLNTFYNAIQVFLSVTAVRVPLLLLYWKVEEYNEASRPSSVCCSCRQDLRGGGASHNEVSVSHSLRLSLCASSTVVNTEESRLLRSRLWAAAQSERQSLVGDDAKAFAHLLWHKVSVSATQAFMRSCSPQDLLFRCMAPVEKLHPIFYIIFLNIHL